MEDKERKKQLFEDIILAAQSGDELAMLLRTVLEERHDIKTGEFLYYLQTGVIK
jgi:hypothetical protein